MKLVSRSFPEGGTIPARYTCDGGETSPELSWSEVPDGTESYALIVDDPDAPRGTFVHWVLFNIGGNRAGLEEGRLPAECVQGANDAGTSTYAGPCPPRGRPHSYHFKLYALDTRLGLKRGAARREVESAMRGHVLDSTEIVGLYGR